MVSPLALDDHATPLPPPRARHGSMVRHASISRRASVKLTPLPELAPNTARPQRRVAVTSEHRRKLLASNSRKAMAKAQCFLRDLAQKEEPEEVAVEPDCKESSSETKQEVSGKATTSSGADFAKQKRFILEALGRPAKARTMGDIDLISAEIAAIEVFARADADRKHALLRALNCKTVAEGDTIVTREGRQNAVYVVYHGKIEMRTENGTRVHCKGDVFGEALLEEPLDATNATDRRWKGTYVAVADSLLLVAKRGDLVEAQAAQAAGVDAQAMADLVQDLAADGPRTPLAAKKIAKTLRAFDFFKQLPLSAIKKIANAAELRTLEPGEQLDIELEAADPSGNASFALRRPAGRNYSSRNSNASTRSTSSFRTSGRASATRSSKASDNSNEAAWSAAVQRQRERRRNEPLYFILRGTLKSATQFFTAATSAGPEDASRWETISYGTGDALQRSQLAEATGPVSPMEAADDDDGGFEVLLLVVPAADAWAALSATLKDLDVVFPMALCCRILLRPPAERAELEIDLLLRHCSSLGADGAGGFFGRSNLSRAHLRALCGRLTLQRAADEQPICYEGEVGRSFYVLLTGSAAVYRRAKAGASTKALGGQADGSPRSPTSPAALARSPSSRSPSSTRSLTGQRASATSPKNESSSSPKKFFEPVGSENDISVEEHEDDEDDDDEEDEEEACTPVKHRTLAADTPTLGVRKRVLGAGATFGERSLITATARSASVVARGDCQLIVLDESAFDALCDEGLVLGKEVTLSLLALYASSESRTPQAAALLANYLRGTLSFFSTAPASLFAELLPGGLTLEKRQPGELVYAQGDESSDFYILVSGTVLLFQRRRADALPRLHWMPKHHRDDPMLLPRHHAPSKDFFTKTTSSREVTTPRFSPVTRAALQKKKFRDVDPTARLAAESGVPEVAPLLAKYLTAWPGDNSSSSDEYVMAPVALVASGDSFGADHFGSHQAEPRLSFAAASSACEILRVSRARLMEWQHSRRAPSAPPSQSRDLLRAERCRQTLRHVPPVIRTEDEMQLLLELFRRHGIFEEHAPAVQREVCRYVWMREVHRGEVVWSARGDEEHLAEEHFYIILKGSVGAYLQHEEIEERLSMADQGEEDDIADPTLTAAAQSRRLWRLTAEKPQAPTAKDNANFGALLPKIFGFGAQLLTLRAGEAFGEPTQTGGSVLRCATVVAQEQTELLVLSRRQFLEIFEKETPGWYSPKGVAHLRPFLLKSRLGQLRRYEETRPKGAAVVTEEEEAAEALVPITKRRLSSIIRLPRSGVGRKTTLDDVEGGPSCSRARLIIKSKTLFEKLRFAFYEELLRPLPTFQEMPDDVLSSLIPLLRCDFYEAKSEIVKINSEVDRVYVLALGSVEILTAQGGVAGDFSVGDQFGHIALLRRMQKQGGRKHPLAHCARTASVTVSMTSRNYFAHWHDVYDKRDVALFSFLSEIPLCAKLSLADIMTVRSRLTRLSLRRGFWRPMAEMGDDVYLIVQGECQLVEVGKHGERGKAVASVGRYGAFAKLGEHQHELALLARSAETEVVRCSLTWMRRELPKLVEVLQQSIGHIADFFSSSKAMSGAFSDDGAADRRKTRREARFAKPREVDYLDVCDDASWATNTVPSSPSPSPRLFDDYRGGRLKAGSSVASCPVPMWQQPKSPNDDSGDEAASHCVSVLSFPQSRHPQPAVPTLDFKKLQHSAVHTSLSARPFYRTSLDRLAATAATATAQSAPRNLPTLPPMRQR